MRKSVRSGVRLAVLGALATFALAMAPSAHAQTYYMIESWHGGGGYCLGADSAGRVYLNVCSGGNIYQQWERWQGGWTRNRALGRCMQADPSRVVSTQPCNSTNPFQFWRNWQGGWFQRPAANGSIDLCLHRDWMEFYVQAVPCSVDDPFNPDPANVWLTWRPST